MKKKEEGVFMDMEWIQNPIINNGLKVLCVLAVLAVIAYKWRRASRYVDTRNELYAKHREKQRQYRERCKQDRRWPTFWQQLQMKYPVSEGEVKDKNVYELHDLNIADVNGAQFEPNAPGSESVSMYAYLKRGSNPKYLQVEYTADGKLIERKIGSMTWYDLFDKAV
jgi:hypothetical protein